MLEKEKQRHNYQVVLWGIIIMMLLGKVRNEWAWFFRGRKERADTSGELSYQ